MVTSWSKIRQLHVAELVVLAQALILLPLCGVLVRLLGFQTVQGLLARFTPSRPFPVDEGTHLRRGRRTAYLVDGAARYGPFRATCLPRSLVCWWLLRRQGIEVSLQIGVRKSETDQFQAHAWVEWHGQILNDQRDVRQRFRAFPRAVIPAESLQS